MDAEHNLRCSVKPALYICIKLFILVSRTTKIDDFDARLVCLPQKYVFGFHVAMHNVVVSQKPKSDQELDSKSPDKRFANTLEIVKLEEVVQIQ